MLMRRRLSAWDIQPPESTKEVRSEVQPVYRWARVAPLISLSQISRSRQP